MKSNKIPTYGIYNTPEVYDMITAPGTGWNWANLSELNPNDPLYQNAVSQGLDRYLVNQNKELVPFSTVQQFVDNHNYQRQLPYQEQNDINDAALMNIRAGDRSVRNRSMTQANKTEMNNLAGLTALLAGTGAAGAGIAASPLIGTAGLIGGLYGANKGSEIYNKYAWPVYNRMAQTIFPSMPSYNTFEDAVEGITNGYIRRDNAALSNPGGVTGGILGGGMGAKVSGATADMAKYTADRGTWYAPIEYATAHTPQGKRFLYTLMNTSDDPTINGVLDGIKSTLKKPSKMNAILKYIFTGKTSPHPNGEGYYASFNPDNELFTGIYNGGNAFYTPLGPKRAILYGTPLDPNYFKYIGGKETIGALESWYNERYPQYMGNLRVYETVPQYSDAVNLPKGTISSTGHKGSKGDFALDSDHTLFYNGNGHRYENGVLQNGTKVSRRHDLYKFQPKDYNEKWTKKSHVPEWKKTLARIGTGAIEEASKNNMILVRTPWEISPF